MNQPKLRLSNPIRPVYTPKTAKYKIAEPATLTAIDVGYPRGPGRHGARKDASLARVRLAKPARGLSVWVGWPVGHRLHGAPRFDSATLYLDGKEVAKFDPASIEYSQCLDPRDAHMGSNEDLKAILDVGDDSPLDFA